MSRFFLDDCWYFVTVPVAAHRPVFVDLERRQKLLVRLEEGFQRFGIAQQHFAIMADHYHLLFPVADGAVIPKLLQFVNGGISFQLGQEAPSPLWGEYHVFVPMTEELFERVLGYVVGNPVKHGNVATLQDLVDWPFSTFGRLVEEEGWERVQTMVGSVIPMSEEQFFQSLPGTGLKPMGKISKPL